MRPCVLALANRDRDEREGSDMPSDQDARSYQMHELWIDDLDRAQEYADLANGGEQGPLLQNDRDHLLDTAAELPGFTDEGREYYVDLIEYVHEQVQVLRSEQSAVQQ